MKISDLHVVPIQSHASDKMNVDAMMTASLLVRFFTRDKARIKAEVRSEMRMAYIAFAIKAKASSL